MSAKLKYKIQYDSNLGEWLTGRYWWCVNNEFTTIGSGWSYTEKGAMRNINRAIAKFREGKPPVYTVDEGEL